MHDQTMALAWQIPIRRRPKYLMVWILFDRFLPKLLKKHVGTTGLIRYIYALFWVLANSICPIVLKVLQCRKIAWRNIEKPIGSDTNSLNTFWQNSQI